MPSLEDVERNYISEVLRQTHGKKVKAARFWASAGKPFSKNEKNTASNEAPVSFGSGKPRILRSQSCVRTTSSRIEHFLPLNIVEVKEPKRGCARRQKILAALRFRSRCGPGSERKDLDLRATREIRSTAYEVRIARRLTFVIGGYEGLADSVKTRADVQWSLSPLTFTHDLTRVVLLEQLYRALSIIRNLPYSR